MRRFIPYGWLLFIGISWGATQPLAKIAVSSGYQPLGLIFWQMSIGVVVLGAVNLIRRRPLPINRRVVPFYLAIALIGTVIPNAASYKAYTVLPAGIMSLLLSLIPMIAFPIALMLGLDRFSFKRMAGLSLGLFAVLLIIGVPEALPNAAMLAFIPLGLLPSLMYAFEGNFVARFGTGGAGPLQLLLGASIIGVGLTGPLAVYSGQWINPLHVWGIADVAVVTSALIHSIVFDDCTPVWSGFLGAGQLCCDRRRAGMGHVDFARTLRGTDMAGFGSDVSGHLFGKPEFKGPSKWKTSL